jgi:hypothetical protein
LTIVALPDDLRNAPLISPPPSWESEALPLGNGALDVTVVGGWLALDAEPPQP